MGSDELGRNLSDFLFEYNTPRMIALRDKRIGLIFRLIQLIVLVYIVGWVFIHEKGYQYTDSITSSVSIKVKGFGFTNLSTIGPRVLDTVDYTFPSQGSDSFVIMTNYIITPKQSMKLCTQHHTSGECESDSDCPTGSFSRYGQGIMNGKCLNNSEGVKACEVFGWCLAENDSHLPKSRLPQKRSQYGPERFRGIWANVAILQLYPGLHGPPLLKAAENFTIFIKNSITFTAFGVSRRNIVESITKAYLQNCTYHKVHHPLCPIFRLGYIAEEINENFSALAYRGAIIGIVIHWDCDLDWPVTQCKPAYSFHQLYRSPTKDQVSVGFNFRYAKYYVENGTEMRDLYKVFGIRFDVMVHGKAGKFNIIPTMTTVGSGIGVFGVATIVCDLVLLHLISKRNYYKQKKFKNVEASLPSENEN